MTDILEADKIRLGNLYLYHVLAFTHRAFVVCADGTREEASEQVMRFIEHEAGITEDKCVAHRDRLVKGLYERRMDYLYESMGEVLEMMCHVEKATVGCWFGRWPTAMPLVEVSQPVVRPTIEPF